MATRGSTMARRLGSPRSVRALAASLVCCLSCAPDPAQLRAERTIEAEYDLETGRLQLITFDSDDNGVIDTWSYMDGNIPLRTEIDQDEDGTVDRWEYYRENRTLEKVGFSRGGGGVVDAWAFEGDDGEVARIEVSTLANGTVDRWEHYEAGALVRVEEDLDFDGGADKWETREAGRVATVAFDQNGDGRPERRLVYDAGVLVAIESEPDEQGVYRNRVDVTR